MCLCWLMKQRSVAREVSITGQVMVTVHYFCDEGPCCIFIPCIVSGLVDWNMNDINKD